MVDRNNTVALRVRISPDASGLLGELAAHLNMTRKSVLELVIREKAVREGLIAAYAPGLKTPLPDRPLPTAADVYAVAAEVEAIGWKGTLGPGADSREAIYGERA